MSPLLRVMGLFLAGGVKSRRQHDWRRPTPARVGALKGEARPSGHGRPGLVEEPDDARRIAKQHGIPKRHTGRFDQLDPGALVGAIVTAEPNGDVGVAFVCAAEPGSQERPRRDLDDGRGVARGIIGTRSKNRSRLRHDRLATPRVLCSYQPDRGGRDIVPSCGTMFYYQDHRTM